MTVSTQMTAASGDPSFALGVLFTVAAGFFAIALNYYLRLTGAGETLFIRSVRRRLRRASRFLAVPQIGRLLWLVDVTLVLSWRTIALIYVAVIWFVVVPVLITLGSIAVAAAIISP